MLVLSIYQKRKISWISHNKDWLLIDFLRMSRFRIVIGLLSLQGLEFLLKLSSCSLEREREGLCWNDFWKWNDYRRIFIRFHAPPLLHYQSWFSVEFTALISIWYKLNWKVLRLKSNNLYILLRLNHSYLIFNNVKHDRLSMKVSI